MDDLPLTLANSAMWLSIKHDFPVSERAVIDLIEQERLSICFKVRSKELFDVTIRRPDGLLEKVSKPFRLTGLLKSLVPPQGSRSLQASLVRLIRADGRPVVEGHRLPMELYHGGLVQPGYMVDGWIDFIDIAVEDWLFLVDDLRTLLPSVGNDVTTVSRTDMGSAGQRPDTEQSVSSETKHHIQYLAKLHREFPAATAPELMRICKKRCETPGQQDADFPFFIVDRELILKGKTRGCEGVFKNWFTDAKKLALSMP